MTASRSELEGRNITYTLNPRLVRGLDYYTRITFEITSGALGAQNALVGGGRYDGLVEMLGGPATPGIGFSIGQDRLILAVEAAAALKADTPLQACIVWMGEPALAPALRLLRELRAEGVSAEMDYEPIKIKRALGNANKLQARFAIIIGERRQLRERQVSSQKHGDDAAVRSRAAGDCGLRKNKIKN